MRLGTRFWGTFRKSPPSPPKLSKQEVWGPTFDRWDNDDPTLVQCVESFSRRRSCGTDSALPERWVSYPFPAPDSILPPGGGAKTRCLCSANKTPDGFIGNKTKQPTALPWAEILVIRWRDRDLRGRWYFPPTRRGQAVLPPPARRPHLKGRYRWLLNFSHMHTSTYLCEVL